MASSQQSAQPPAYPPPVQPSSTSRRTYIREDSLSPSRSTARSLSARRFSHSKSRPASGSSPAPTDPSSRDESQDSRSRDRGRSTSRHPLISSLSDTPAVDRVNSLPPIVRRFLGRRDANVTSSPLLPPLNHLSAQHESILLTFIGSFTSILLVSAIGYGLYRDGFSNELPIAIGSMGATAVLIYAMPEVPVSQPRNTICGHVIAAVVGICISYLFSLSPHYDSTNGSSAPLTFYHLTPVAGALSVALSISIMQLTKTLHPPGGATSLLAAVLPNIVDLHFRYLLLVLLSVLTMVGWACVIGNIGRRKYPAYWWTPPPPPKPAPPEPEKRADIREQKSGSPGGPDEPGSRLANVEEEAEPQVRGRKEQR